MRVGNPIRAYSGRPLKCRSVSEDFVEKSSPFEAAKLLNCNTWSRAGPELMDAVTKGALEAEKPVGGIKIEKEAGE